jgi:hypothetical protein
VEEADQWKCRQESEVMDAKAKHDLEETLTRKLLDEGKLIAAGWAMFHHLLLKDAPPIQVREMEKAFFAGAQHLWGSIMTGLDPDAEPTAQDERRMELIAAELDAFGERLKSEIETEGRA